MDAEIVIRPMIVTRERISFVKCPTLTPSAIRISENSLICATVKPAWNDVLFLYPRIPISAITTRGFPIRMKRENIIAGMIRELIDPNAIWEPRRMKNAMMKKSLKGRSFALISWWNGDIDRATPATSAPISIENPM